MLRNSSLRQRGQMIELAAGVAQHGTTLPDEQRRVSAVCVFTHTCWNYDCNLKRV